jgi:Mlo family
MAGDAAGAAISSPHAPSTELSELLLVVLIITSLTMEFLLHRLERWVALRHRHLQSVIRNLYRELLILGAVSFVFIFYEATSHPPKKTVASFEFAHVFIFLLAIVHTLVVLCTVAASLNLSKRWRQMEQMDLVQYLELKEQFRRARLRRLAHHGPLWRRLQWWLPDPRTLVRYWRLHEIMAFHDIRFQFLYYRDLPEDFNFSAYLRKVKAVIFIDLVDAHWSLWMVFLFFVVADLVRRQIWDDARFEGAFAITAAGVLAVSAALLTWKIRRVYWALTKHPATYFDHVSKEDVLDHLASPGRVSLSSRSSPAGQTPAVNASDADDEWTDVLDSSATPPSLENPRRSPSDEVTNGDAPAAQPQMGTMGTEAVVAATLRRSLDGRPGHNAGTPIAARRSVDAPSNVYHAATASQPSASNRASFENARITNLVYMEPLDVSGGGSGTEAGKGRGGGKTKPRRVPEPAHPTAVEIAKIAALHSLSVRPDGSRRARSSLDGRLDGRRSMDGSGTPSASPPTGESSPSSRVGQVSRGTADAIEAARRVTMEFVSAGGSGVVRVERDGDVNEGVDSATEALDGGRRSIDRVRRSIDRSPRSVEGGHRRSFDGRRSLDAYRAGGRRRSLEYVENTLEPSSIGLVGSVALLGGPRTVDLTSTLPVDELAGRADHSDREDMEHVAIYVGSGEKDDVDDGALLMDDRVARQAMNRPSFEASRQSKGSRLSTGAAGDRPRYVNKSLVNHAEDMTSARQQAPQYPKAVTFLIPRLRRVASRVEKLFWFGSHRFYLWLVEFTLFFATVLFASSAASFVLLVLRQDAEEKHLNGISIASICSSFGVLVYVLVRISYVMKKYTFVLNNAGLVPEVLALQVIHNVWEKRQVMNEVFAGTHDDASGTDSGTEMSEAARERRRNFSRFFANDAQTSGHIPGAVDGPYDGRFASEGRKAINRIRRSRKRAKQQEIPLVLVDGAPQTGVHSD